MSGGRDSFDDETTGTVKDFPAGEFLYFFKKANSSTVKNNYAIEQLKIQCNESTHPLAVAVVKLLNACTDFLAQTDPVFKQNRKAFKDEMQIERLNTLAAAIKTLVNLEKQPDVSSEQHQTLQEAISFCINCIKARVDELKQSNDPIFSLYKNKPNALKVLLDADQSPSSELKA